MDNQDLVRRFCAACENGDTDTLDEITSDDFTYRHPEGPVTADKHEFLTMMVNMKEAFPDLRLEVQDIETGPMTRALIRWSGTHEGELRVPEGPNLPPTGQRFELPVETASWECVAGVVRGHIVQPTDGGGLPGILEQLGMEMPTAG